MRGHSEIMNQTPKVKRASGDAPYFGQRSNSIAHTVSKGNRNDMRNQTLDYSARLPLNETQRAPDNLHEIQEHMYNRTPNQQINGEI